MKIKNIIAKIQRLKYKFMSNEKYANAIGVHIGKQVFIDTREWGTEPYLITVGNHCQITHNVSFWTHGGGHVMRLLESDFDAFGKILIENNVYIGAYSQIMPGITIGEGSLVAAGSIVTKSVPSGVVVGGNPAKFICTVEQYVQKNIQYNLHTFGMNSREKKKFLSSLEECKFIKKQSTKVLI
jgi:acetyltransferase-like isoleucine patch superfamily enzyme